ncbi:MAG: hypothetical protein NXH88_10055 [Hyphomonas sp.]|nr:hypothetical protein [Hyphomonas sp.]
MTEREKDERDLKILDDLCDGEKQKATAEKYGVSHGYVQRLWRALLKEWEPAPTTNHKDMAA